MHPRRLLPAVLALLGALGVAATATGIALYHFANHPQSPIPNP